MCFAYSSFSLNAVDKKQAVGTDKVFLLSPWVLRFFICKGDNTSRGLVWGAVNLMPMVGLCRQRCLFQRGGEFNLGQGMVTEKSLQGKRE